MNDTEKWRKLRMKERNDVNLGNNGTIQTEILFIYVFVGRFVYVYSNI